MQPVVEGKAAWAFPFLSSSFSFFYSLDFSNKPGCSSYFSRKKRYRELEFFFFHFLCVAGNQTQGLTHVW